MTEREAPKLITRHVYPPIPIRSHDWCAYPEGEEEAGGYGWGPTEEAAVADWHANHPEEDENDALADFEDDLQALMDRDRE